MSTLEVTIAEARARKARAIRDIADARLSALPAPSQQSPNHEKARRKKAERQLREAETGLARAEHLVLDLKVPHAALQGRGPRL